MSRGRDRPDVIAIVQPFVPTYRVALFDAIAQHLGEHGYRLEVWHDQPKGIVAARGNATSGPWSVPIRQHRISVRRRNVTLRRIHREARRVRAVVHGLASSNLETYALAADPRVTLMLWGHGRNFTAAGNGLDDRLERWLCDRATHVFAYTTAGADHLVEAGVSDDKVTVVRNSTDTDGLRRHQDATSEQMVSAFVAEHGLADRKAVLFVGAYDEPKRLPFLFEAIDLMHQADPDVVLLLAGQGPLDDYVHEVAESRPYVRDLGRLDPAGLALVSKVARLIVMPGRVGLVAVDSLALGLPLVTTDHPWHAPEVAYLTAETSMWTQDSPEAYAEGVRSLLDDQATRAAMAAAGRVEAAELSADRAGRRFVDGILQGLE